MKWLHYVLIVAALVVSSARPSPGNAQNCVGYNTEQFETSCDPAGEMCDCTSSQPGEGWCPSSCRTYGCAIILERATTGSTHWGTSQTMDCPQSLTYKVGSCAYEARCWALDVCPNRGTCPGPYGPWINCGQILDAVFVSCIGT